MTVLGLGMNQRDSVPRRLLETETAVFGITEVVRWDLLLTSCYDLRREHLEEERKGDEDLTLMTPSEPLGPT